MITAVVNKGMGHIVRGIQTGQALKNNWMHS
jgi:hypothetical protein